MHLFHDTPSYYNTNALMVRVWEEDGGPGGDVHADMIIDANDGLNGGPAWSASSANGYAIKFHDQVGQSIFNVGMCFKCTSLPGADKVILGVVDAAGDLQASVVLRTTGVLAVYRGDTAGVQIGSDSEEAITTSTTLEIGFKGVISSVGGSAEVWLGTAGDVESWERVIAVSGESTVGGSGDSWRGGYIGATTSTFSSHLYMRDGQSANNNDLVFGYTVGTKFPSTAGIYSGYTANTGTLPAALDDTAADDDTTYAEANAQNASYTVDMGSVADTPIVYAMEAVAVVKNTGDGPAGLTHTIRLVIDADSDPLIFDGSFQSASESDYRALRERFGAGLNPLTGLQYTVDQLNDAELGGFASS
jgi:hypothetical protein